MSRCATMPLSTLLALNLDRVDLKPLLSCGQGMIAALYQINNSIKKPP